MTSDLQHIQLSAREADRSALAKAAQAMIQTVQGGVMDGHRVIALEDLAKVLDAPLEPYKGYGAEIRADNDNDGRLIIWLACPDCNVLQPALATVRASVRSERDGKEIKATVRTKARTHECGQETLPIPGAGGMPWDVHDITGRRNVGRPGEDEDEGDGR